MAEITAALVKDLRERTGAGMMECKKALVEANGDLAEAEVVLRKHGIASAGKKSSRSTKQGLIGTYIHHGGQLGVMVEVNCESGFRAPAPTISKNWSTTLRCTSRRPILALSAEAKTSPMTSSRSEKDDIQRARALLEGKPEKMVDKIVEGRMSKFFEEICLLEQPFVKEATLTVGQLVKTKIAKLGENISVSRFLRYKVGDVAAMEAGNENPAVGA